MKKLNISEERKNFIKENFSKVKKSKLSADEKRYYTLVENGKNRAKNAIRFHGQYLSGEIVGIVQKVAKIKHLSVDDYLEQNKQSVNKLIESGFTETSKQIESSIDILLNSKRKTIEVDTGNGIVRMGRKEAIKMLAEFEQHVKSNTNVAYIATHVKIFKNNKIRLTIPENFEDFEGDELIELLNEFDGIDYVESIEAKK